MKTLFSFSLSLALGLWFGTFLAFGQAGPGPVPDPWVLNGSQLSYNNGCVTLPSTVTGGCEGNGSLNAQSLFIAGAAVPSTALANVWSQTQTLNKNAASLPAPDTGTLLQVGSADGTASRIEATAAASSATFTGRRADGTVASPTTLQNADLIAAFNAHGYDGASWSTVVAGSYRIYSEGVWSSSSHPTEGCMSTTAAASTSVVDQFCVHNDGGVTLPSSVTGGDKGAGTLNISGLYYVGGAQLAFSNLAGQATLAQLPTIGANTVIGSIAGGTPIALSTTQLTTLVNAFTTSLNGAVPNPGSSTGKFLRDDGTWNTVGGSGTITTLTAGSQISFSSGATCTITCTVNTNPTASSVCFIILTSATTCNNTGSAANNGTYTTPSGVLYLEVELCGGGGGGSGSGTGSGNGTAGNNTTFGTSLLTGNGGGAGVAGGGSVGTGGTGGSATGGDENRAGQDGAGGNGNSTSPSGGDGGNSAYASGGARNTDGSTPAAAKTNSGAGGAGGQTVLGTVNAGGGGGAGGCLRKLITSPLSTYAYAVGATASGGSGGTSGSTGSNGAAGYVRVTARYN